jgi:hypothetical protein
VLVVPEDGVFSVVEGNRRVLAMKLLKNPALARGSKIEKPIEEVSRRSVALSDVRCMVAATRDDAKRWIELRHTGSREGVGVVGWNPEMQVRFSQNFSGQRGRAIRLTDALRDAYKDDSEMHDLIRKVRTTKLTTLGRLVNDPDFRTAAGIELRGEEVVTHFSPPVMRPFWHRLLTELSTTLTVSSLKSKEQRARYINTLGDVRPPSEARRPKAAPLTSEPPPAAPIPGIVPAAPPPRRPVAKAQRPRPLNLFYGLSLRNVSFKARDFLREAQRIDLTSFPNAGAVLIRVLVELVVEEGVEHYRLNLPDQTPLRVRIQRCLDELDPTGKADKYAPVRKALSNPDSPLSVTSMHAYLHNAYMHPDITSLRAISENYTPLLAELDAAIGNGRQS